MIRFLRLLFILLLTVTPFLIRAQETTPLMKCATDQLMAKWQQQPAARQKHQQIEEKLLQYRRAHPNATRTGNYVLAVPVVVHIVHNNGPENISDAQVRQAIQYLNESFANVDPYDPEDGVNTMIQFCLARTDPNGNPTTGITRDVSTLTNVDVATDDLPLKNINRWNPNCYINIWVVNEVCGLGLGCNLGGYAYYPSSHGSDIDGIVLEARSMGSSASNNTVLTHEMGHYLGLYHTFQGACTNGDCLADGDKVCDTPPDQLTVATPCNGTVNSCTSDALSGFSTDQNDLSRNYMDYGNNTCFTMFTQGQADRMNWHLVNVRGNLLGCQTCPDICLAPVTANFTTPGSQVGVGTTFTFVNTSVNGSAYEWYINGVLQPTTTNLTFTFATIGDYTIQLVAKSDTNLCRPSVKTVTIAAFCGINVGFTASAHTVPAGSSVTFTNTSVNTGANEWYVNGVLQATSANFTHTSNVPGTFVIKLIGYNANGSCSLTKIDSIKYTCGVTAFFTPQSPIAHTNIPITFTSTSTGVTSYQWFVNNVPTGSNAATFTFTPTEANNYVITLIAGNGNCSVSQSTIAFAKDTCLNTSFMNKFGGAGEDVLQDVKPTPDGGYIACGYTNSFGAGGYDGAVVKTNGNGNVLWTKALGNNFDNIFSRIINTPDNGFLLLGNTFSTPIRSGGWLVKLDASGSVQWSRMLDRTGTGVFAPTIKDIVALSDGNYAFCGTITDTRLARDTAFIGKIDNTGTIQWINLYRGVTARLAGLIEDGAALVTVGENEPIGGLGGDGFLLKVNKTDGSIISAASYHINSRTNYFTGIYKQNNEYLITSYTGSAGQLDGRVEGNIVLRVRQDGTVVHAKRTISTINKTAQVSLAPMNDGGYMLVENQADITGANIDIHLRKRNAQNNLQWVKKLGSSGSREKVGSIIQMADLGVLGCGESSAMGNSDFMLFRVNALGEVNSACSEPSNGRDTVMNYIVSPASWQQLGGSNTLQAINHLLTENVTALLAEQVCMADACVPPVDTCLTNFQIRYPNLGEEMINDVKPVPNGQGYITAGSAIFSGGTNPDAYLLKVSGSGNVHWAKTYGGTGADMFRQVQHTSTGGYIAAGNTNVAGMMAAFVANVDVNGNLRWSRALGNSTNATDGFAVIQTTDGGFAVTGTYNDASGISDILVVRLDAMGTVVWSRTFGGSGADGGNSLIQDNDTLIVAGYTSGATMNDGCLLKLNLNTGNLIWSRSYDVNNQNNAFANLQKIPGGYAVQANASTTLANDNLRQGVLEIDYNGNPLYNHQLITPVSQLAGNTMVRTRDGGYIGTTSEGGSGGAIDDIYFYKVINGQLQWKKRLLQAGVENINSIQEADNGSIVMAGNATDPLLGNNDAYVIKATANGITGCTLTETTATIASMSVVAHTYVPTAQNVVLNHAIPTAGAVAYNQTATTILCSSAISCDSIDIRGDNPTCLSGDTVRYRAWRRGECVRPAQWVIDPLKATIISHTDTTVAIRFLQAGSVTLYASQQTGCRVITDSLVITVQPCENIDTCGLYYTGTYVDTTSHAWADWQPSANGSITVAGYYQTSGTGNDAMIARLNALGQPIWTRLLQGTGNEYFSKVLQASNGNIMAIGYTNSTAPSLNSILISNYTTNGTLRWSRSINDNNAASNITGISIVEDAGGQWLFCGQRLNAATGNSIVVGKLDAAGNTVWIKNLTLSISGNTPQPTVMHLHNDTLLIAGHVTVGQQQGFLLQLNVQTGQVINSRMVTAAPGVAVWINSITHTANSYKVSLTVGGQLGAATVTPTLTITGQQLFNSPLFAGNNNHVIPAHGGGYIGINYRNDGNLSVARVDNVGQVAWVKSAAMGTPISLLPIKAVPGGYAVVINQIIGGIVQPMMIKMDAGAYLGFCNASNAATFTLSSPGLSAISNGTWDNTDITPANNQVWIPYTASRTPNHTISCPTTGNCNTLQLIGPANACNLQDTVTYYAQRSAQCQLPVKWQVDAATAQIISYTDTSIAIRWLQTGTTNLYAELQTACTVIKDTITVSVRSGAAPVNLGPDKLICPGSTLNIHAGTNYQQYIWQDGFDDSVYTAYQPGTYYVKVKDFCNNEYRDTIVVTAAVAPLFDLGIPRELCLGDTLTITAPAGFTEYSWAPNYHISSRQGQTVTVWPRIDTLYAVTAISSEGCLVYNTLRIHINLLPSVQLGNDTSICQGNNITLNTPAGFTGYLWSNNTVATSITINTAGLYWVQVTDAQGCKGRDTMRLGIYPIPSISLGTDTVLCIGNSIRITPGNNFAAYLWQDNTTASSYTTNTVGIYWVRVTDANNCTASDTMQVLRIGVPPRNFVPANTSMCTYQPIIVAANGNFSQYRWSNGTTTATTSITAPGNYWLVVTTADGCTARETFTVADKNCPPAIYFPNAFTPGGDGRNDRYKPGIYGKLERYSLEIFNRYGQRVFYTTNPTVSWDGSYQGIIQNQGAYVWVCIYQFQGLPPATDRGSLILIR